MNYVSTQRSSHFYYRNEIISHLDTNYLLLSNICQSLESYMKKVRKLVEGERLTYTSVQLLLQQYMYAWGRHVYM